jgi:hypothetical protein
MKTSQQVQKAYQFIEWLPLSGYQNTMQAERCQPNAAPSEIAPYRIPAPSPQINFFELRVDKSVGDSP